MWRCAKRRSREQGYLLFEVMVAVVILSAGIAVALRSFSGSLQGVRMVEGRMAARLRLEEKVGDLRRRGVSGAGKVEGGFPDAPGSTWSVQATPFGDVPGLYQAEVAVHWAERGRQRRTGTVILVQRRSQVGR
ncbi:MAG: hypothetical protein A3F84_06410 [Candidatus Handelsmanbacteria bacterium RIFCSPLOWO2_12_FULL_64_10]|uniref:Type II secretion system protein GspI C-terminal domain-containing protein n=1 Tax=Handelsmanbacteria sp. (strain RIFCSPLOWO2_12_FULL_64_10) TaxID=1817868 RepID=A0A1F6CRD8_HANXR|nr:MAG: hypothetical protein A3F84_06410 [Candidatus Handelsmanbacteria bacterium RIFCSPLOWO2_12_FULL_64_10]